MVFKRYNERGEQCRGCIHEKKVNLGNVCKSCTRIRPRYGSRDFYTLPGYNNNIYIPNRIVREVMS